MRQNQAEYDQESRIIDRIQNTGKNTAIDILHAEYRRIPSPRSTALGLGNALPLCRIFLDHRDRAL
jgi:predicted mannosyl-3-phosphoglycerate phosphatase (HAD superfamily)